VISDDDANRYLGEMAQLAVMMGATNVPTSMTEVEHYYDEIWASLAVDRRARSAVRFLLWPPVERKVRPAYVALCAAAVATLPMRVRRALWLPEAPTVDRAVVGPAAESVIRVLGWALGDSPIVAAAMRRAGTRAVSESPQTGEDGPTRSGSRT
jgi:uncharacterized protein (DUF2236 family)